MNRSFTQPGTPAAGAPAAGAAAKGGFFNRPGMMGGMLGGLAMGFLGAGLFGMLSGSGLFSGLGSLSSIIGLLLQIGLIIIVVRLAMSWWQRRHAPASAYATGPAAGTGGPAEGPGAQTSFRSGMGFGLGSSQPALEIQPADYEAFERLLGEVQAAWSNEDVDKLHTLATPEMVSYLSKDLEENKARNDVNKVSDVKLLQGDLAEAWREGETDYASVAMRFSLVDKTLERATGRVVAGSDTPIEATEVWTFARRRGGDWELSAIQQTS
jgi:predicted lipid-binding transport protein (Tim44 family)